MKMKKIVKDCRKNIATLVVTKSFFQKKKKANKQPDDYLLSEISNINETVKRKIVSSPFFFFVNFCKLILKVTQTQM